jgi:hypothetical protein
VSCLGVHIALTAEQEQDVWTHFYDETILDLVEALRADDDEEHRQRTDKAWDPIHRCLSDGTLVWDAGRWPLRGAILGSESLYFSGDFVVMLLERGEVVEVAGALDAVTQEWFRERFLALPGHGYQGATDEDAFDYTWYWFERMRAFFRKTADEGRAMLFTADQ